MSREKELEEALRDARDHLAWAFCDHGTADLYNAVEMACEALGEPIPESVQSEREMIARGNQAAREHMYQEQPAVFFGQGNIPSFKTDMFDTGAWSEGRKLTREEVDRMTYDGANPLK